MLGYTYEQLLGKHLWEIGFFKDRARSRPLSPPAERWLYPVENLPLESKDGRQREVEFVSNMYKVGQEK